MIIRLSWWDDRVTYNGLSNYGDLMSLYLVKKISKKLVISSNHKYNRFITKFIKRYYLCIGSILSTASENSIVWGSGILSKNEQVENANFCAVRGPETRRRLLELGYKVPEIYGDPALLLPLHIKNDVDKKYELGIIPHHVDYNIVVKALKRDKQIKVINLLTNDVERTTREILECKTIISSSLHGVIVPHAYGIPALWVKFSNKLSGDNIKFFDYYKSVGINFKEELNMNPSALTINQSLDMLKNNSNVLLPKGNVIEKMQIELLKACPFN